jgi:hypothetical protein
MRLGLPCVRQRDLALGKKETLLPRNRNSHREAPSAGRPRARTERSTTRSRSDAGPMVATPLPDLPLHPPLNEVADRCNPIAGITRQPRLQIFHDELEFKPSFRALWSFLVLLQIPWDLFQPRRSQSVRSSRTGTSGRETPNETPRKSAKNHFSARSVKPKTAPGKYGPITRWRAKDGITA